MIDARLLPLQRQLLAPPAHVLARLGVQADHISIGGFVVGALAVPALAFGAHGLALMFLLLNRLADGLDGEVARASVGNGRQALDHGAAAWRVSSQALSGQALSGQAADSGAADPATSGQGLPGRVPSDRGAFLDVALDFMFYALFPLGFALADPFNNALAAAVLITSFVGTGSSFLAFATIAALRGTTAADYPAKGIYYLGGLTEGAETIAVFTLMCLIPIAFPILAYLFAAACCVTTLLRWHQGWTAFSHPLERP